MPTRLLTSLLASIVLLLALAAQPATAAIGGVVPLDSPELPPVVELADSDMSEDGTAGVVYVVNNGGQRQIWASVLRGGGWIAPQRVDNGQLYDSYVPRVGAADGGRIVVTWVQRGPTEALPDLPRHDRLYSASLDPGATLFKLPVPIDLDVGDAATVFPDLSMNRDGQAYVVYRVVTRFSGSDIPEGYLLANYRAARYNGWTWSRLDQTLDRNPSAIEPQPTADNAPSVTTDRYGNAVFAFQEPGDDFVDRIWIRRVFGQAIGLPLLVSPTTFGGIPLRGSADRPSLASGPFGNSVITFRQAPGNPSGLDRTRLFANLLPDMFTENSTTLSGAVPIDNGGADSTSPYTGHSAAITTRQKFIALFGVDTRVRLTEGTEVGLTGEAEAGTASADASEPGITIADDESRSMAWVAGPADAQHVAIGEQNSDGASVSTQAALAGGQAISAMKFAGTINADAIVAFSQRVGSQNKLAAVRVDARPGQFIVFEPEDWLRTRSPRAEWEPAFDTSGVRYDVELDGKPVATTAERHADLGRRVKDGLRLLTVTATDALGQSRRSETVTLRLDRKAPIVRVKRMRRGVVRVTLNDGRRGRVSGIASRSSIRWGDGKRSRAGKSKTRRYKKRGTVRVVVTAFDRAGNRRTVRKSIRL